MLPLFVDDDPHIYFLTHQNSRKIGQITAKAEVALTVNDGSCLLMVTGRANVLSDANLLDKLWHPTYRAWFPGGKGDRDVAIIRIAIDRVDYWEPPRSSVARIVEAAKALLTRTAVDTEMKTIGGL